jgi:hypothetical protein
MKRTHLLGIGFFLILLSFSQLRGGEGICRYIVRFEEKTPLADAKAILRSSGFRYLGRYEMLSRKMAREILLAAGPCDENSLSKLQKSPAVLQVERDGSKRVLSEKRGAAGSSGLLFLVLFLPVLIGIFPHKAEKGNRPD